MDTYRDPRSALEHRIDALDMIIESFQAQRERVLAEELRRRSVLARTWLLVMAVLYVVGGLSWAVGS